MGERKRVRFYPWELSATGSWSPETGIYKIRDLEVEELAKLLWEPGIHVQNTAIVELLAHGNPRKAAELVRELIKQYPVTEKSIKEGFSGIYDYLTKTPLEDLPSRPSEYPPDVVVEYIQ